MRAQPNNSGGRVSRRETGPPDDAPAQELLERTRWIIALRWLAAPAIVVVSAIPSLFHLLGLPDVAVYEPGLLWVAAAAFLYNVVFWFYQRRIAREADLDAQRIRLRRFANFQIATDLLMITLCLHFSGGIQNPCVMFYVFHIIIASSLLTRRSSYLQAALATAMYATMAILEAIFPDTHHPLWEYLPGDVHRQVPFLVGGTLALGITLLISAYLAHSIAGKQHQREAELEVIRQNLERRTADLSAANAELARLQDAKSHFLRVAAHQLKSPLSSIISSLSVIEKGYIEDREKEHNLIRRAIARTHALSLLVSDLLKLSGARTAIAQSAAASPLLFDAAIARAVQLYRPDAESKSVALDWSPGCGSARVLVPEEALLDVITNLLSNAIKYTPSGGRVSVKTWRTDDQVHCRVSDTGIGIPKGDLEKCFSEFFRARNARELQAEGTGLGLAIVKETLAACGGHVEVSSLVGLGTMFVFHLPLHKSTRRPSRNASPPMHRKQDHLNRLAEQQHP